MAWCLVRVELIGAWTAMDPPSCGIPLSIATRGTSTPLFQTGPLPRRATPMRHIGLVPHLERDPHSQESADAAEQYRRVRQHAVAPKAWNQSPDCRASDDAYPNI